jgi:hypothetical protein
MLGSLFQHNDIDGVIVGADRVVKNGDTANKASWSHTPVLGGWGTVLTTVSDRDIPGCGARSATQHPFHGRRPSDHHRPLPLHRERVRRGLDLPSPT